VDRGLLARGRHVAGHDVSEGARRRSRLTAAGAACPGHAGSTAVVQAAPAPRSVGGCDPRRCRSRARAALGTQRLARRAPSCRSASRRRSSSTVAGLRPMVATERSSCSSVSSSRCSGGGVFQMPRRSGHRDQGALANSARSAPARAFRRCRTGCRSWPHRLLDRLRHHLDLRAQSSLALPLSQAPVGLRERGPP
jgi:hypothetical protein